LRQQEERLNELDVQVMVITFDADFMALAYIKETNLPWPLLLDSETLLYHAYGMTRGGWWSIYGLPSIMNYLQLMAKGRKPGKPGKDWRQLGGDVLIDPKGIVRIHHISTGPHDRPTVDLLLAHIEAAE
jgi:hypothetical protein